MEKSRVGIFIFVLLGCCKLVAGADPKIQDNTIVWQNANSELIISLKSPEIYLKGYDLAEASSPLTVSGDLLSGKPVEIEYAAVKLNGQGQLYRKLIVQYSPKENTVRKWVLFKTDGGLQTVLNEVVYDKYDSKALLKPLTGGPPQSYPAFFKGFFAGIEYPIASTREDTGKLIIGFRPGEKLTDKWYTGRTAIYGMAKEGNEKNVFLQYIADHRPEPRNFHLNYCSWWSAPILYSEKDIAYLMNEFKEHLYKPYGISLDSFAIDMGWSDAKTIWKINKGFPDGFKKINDLAASMHSNLALWISPANHYSPNAIDSEWARDAGYETYTIPQGNRLCCMAGPKYYSAYNESLLDIAKKYKIHHLKVDGYCLECPDANHGHEPGIYSSDKTASNGIKTFEALRAAVPEIWIEATCFGNASPWWLLYVNSTIGSFGDDSPPGRVPCPIYRQSYTTARDFYNLHGTQTMMSPIVAQEELGLIHQSNDDFTDDAIVTILRGNAFVPLYIDPTYMNDQRWKSLAQLIKWAKSNNALFENTTVLLPEDWKKNGLPGGNGTMPRQVYGYAHGSEGKSILLLRNPWIQKCEYDVTLDESIGLNKKDGEYSIISIYPQECVYKSQVTFGTTVKIPLAPYETLVLTVSTDTAANGLADVKSVIDNKIAINSKYVHVDSVEYAPAPEIMADDTIDLAYKYNNAVEINAAVKFDLTSSQGKLLILCESNSPDIDLNCKISLNGKNAEVYADGTSTGWRATGLPNAENWLFFWVPLSKGINDANIAVLAKNKNVRISGWIWSYTKADQKNAMQFPKPEIISLDSAKFIDVIDCSRVGGDIVKKTRPITKINGIYLDAVKNINGKFKRNLCDNNSLINIKGIRYVRGLGTTVGTINIPLESGRYSRFNATTGVDSSMITDHLDKTQIMFLVKLDGKEVWKSKPLTIRDQPEYIDIDISDANVLSLETVPNESRGRRYTNLANWADAALINK